ncbi:MAG: helix-turn-helix domain-containing protein [bacterium]|nr:helix-turn-helix domain-containing protein [bacterium]
MTTIRDQLLISLTDINFEENEAAVYLASLEHGLASVWDIAQTSGVKRSTCYVILDKFMRRGLASQAKDGRRTLFRVISPKELLKTFEHKRDQLAGRLSELEALASHMPSKPNIRLFVGAEGVKQAYNLALLEQNTTIYIYGTGKVFEIYPDYFSFFTKSRLEKKIHIQGIASDTSFNQALSQGDKKMMRELRFLPSKKFNPQQEVLIFGNTIAYVAVLDREPFATVVESKLFADSEKERFNLLWEIAKPQNKVR